MVSASNISEIIPSILKPVEYLYVRKDLDTPERQQCPVQPLPGCGPQAIFGMSVAALWNGSGRGFPGQEFGEGKLPCNGHLSLLQDVTDLS